MMRRVAVRGVVFFNDMLLCAQLKAYPGSLASTSQPFWCLPGGGLENGESLTDGLVREMVEETGVIPEIGKLLYIQQFAHKEHEFLEFFFHIANGPDYQSIKLAETTHGQKEISIIAFINPKEQVILPEFLSREPLRKIIMHESPTRVYSYL